MIKWNSPNRLLSWFEDHNKTNGYILGRKKYSLNCWSDTKLNKITSRFSNAFRHLDLEQRWVFASLFHAYLNFYHSIFEFTNPIFCLCYSTICCLQSVFFIFSRSLLNLSCIFSVLASRLFICDSILISRFWINFTIIIRNSLSGRFPISPSFFLVWWAFILFLYLLGIPLSLHLV